MLGARHRPLQGIVRNLLWFLTWCSRQPATHQAYSALEGQRRSTSEVQANLGPRWCACWHTCFYYLCMFFVKRERESEWLYEIWESITIWCKHVLCILVKSYSYYDSDFATYVHGSYGIGMVWHGEVFDLVVTRPFATVLVNSMLQWKSWELGAWQIDCRYVVLKGKPACDLCTAFYICQTPQGHRCSRYTTVSIRRPCNPTLHNVKSWRQRAEVHQWRSGFEAFLCILSRECNQHRPKWIAMTWASCEIDGLAPAEASQNPWSNLQMNQDVEW